MRDLVDSASHSELCYIATAALLRLYRLSAAACQQKVLSRVRLSVYLPYPYVLFKCVAVCIVYLPYPYVLFKCVAVCIYLSVFAGVSVCTMCVQRVDMSIRSCFYS